MVKQINQLPGSAGLADGDQIAKDNAGNTLTEKITGTQLASYVLGKETEETPTGDKDGVNTVFSIVSTPRAGTIFSLYINGVRGIDPDDYSLSGTTLTLVTPPVAEDKIRAVYLT